MRPLLVLPLVLAAAACAGGAASTPAGPPTPEAARGVPGFDTRDYPGDDVMRSWLDASPYRWVGFYLPAPCYTGDSWTGRRSTLRAMGWGLAVLFVGEQDWSAGAHAPAAAAVARDTAADTLAADTLAADGVAAAPARCTSGNLSAERGARDGAAAAEAARAEGFPASTVLYLDVERVDSVSRPLREYVEGWTRALGDAGYRPGLYAHARNAETLIAAMGGAMAGAGDERPRLWVASPGGFSLRRAPAESGFPATIWQGELDVDERWAGTALRIDRNVADRPDPSG